MGAREETIEDALVVVTTGGIVAGALVALATAGFPEATLLARVGQLLSVVGFGAGAAYFARTDREWPAAGMAVVALAWVVPFAEVVLERLFGELYAFLSLGVVTIGLVVVLIGFRAARPLHEVLPTTDQTERQ